MGSGHGNYKRVPFEYELELENIDHTRLMTLAGAFPAAIRKRLADLIKWGNASLDINLLAENRADKLWTIYPDDIWKWDIILIGGDNGKIYELSTTYRSLNFGDTEFYLD